MAEDWTGLTKPSKRLVKSYKVLYVPDALPPPIYPVVTPAPRPSSGSTTSSTGNAFAVAKPTSPGARLIATYPPNTTFIMGGVTYNSGAGGCNVFFDISGSISVYYK